jgi:predicted DNA-binding protein
MNTTISVQIPTELSALLSKISKDEDRSKSSIVRIALQEYLEDLEDTKAGERAYKKWVRGGKKSHSLEEVAMEDGIDLES